MFQSGIQDVILTVKQQVKKIHKSINKILQSSQETKKTKNPLSNIIAWKNFIG